MKPKKRLSYDEVKDCFFNIRGYWPYLNDLYWLPDNKGRILVTDGVAMEPPNKEALIYWSDRLWRWLFDMTGNKRGIPSKDLFLVVSKVLRATNKGTRP